MKKTLAVVILAAASIHSPPSRAQTVLSAINLATKCSAEQDTADINYCYGYLVGVFDGLAYYGLNGKTPVFCPQGLLTAAQLRDVYMEWLARNGQLSTQEASQIARASMLETFRCK